MGGGISTSNSSSFQSAAAFLSQNSQESCNIVCQNVANDINIDIINSVIGGDINLTQSCSVNSSCLMSSASDATSDILTKASNSSNAKNAGGLFNFSIDQANTMSRQQMKQTIIQATSQTCKMASLNQMNDITILAANSVIGGSINIGQTGSTSGQCQLQNNLSAAATATAMASNVSSSGKDKKGEKKGSSSVFYTIIGVIMFLVIIYVLAKMYTNGTFSDAQEALKQTVQDARGRAGCPSGSPMLDKLGKIIIDPISNRPICPPGSIKPIPSIINVNLGEELSSLTKEKL